MLRELHVTDLGVIADVDLSFHPGLNVLTGETGAGKTMITVALGLALGRRASGSLVREGARTARVQARFDATTAAEEEGWAEDGSLVLARAIDADGRSTARVGGQISTVSVLERLATGLVEVHGQHDSASLGSPAAQTGFLDRFAGPEHLVLLGEHAGVHRRLSAASRELDELVRTEREREREADVLAFQIGEIEAVEPRPGELAELEPEIVRLANAERLLELAGAGELALAGEGGAAEQISVAAGALQHVAELDPAAAALAERARSLREEAADLAREARGYREGLEADPARLELANARVAAVRGLLRKYGDSEEAVLEFLERARQTASALGGSGRRREELEEEVGALEAEAAAGARAIRAGRAAAAPALGAALEAELNDLGMSGASIEVSLVDVVPSASGTERAELVFSGGPRQRPMPLSRVASGGELSRAMLACRSVLVDADAVPTLVFDEVDSGIGGIAAAAVGRRLAMLARERQVLVVTHLPQIAALADRHLVVDKVDGVAGAREVDGAERVGELSRMLAGLKGSESAAAHAEELLAEAGRVKGS
jgi:DNA repair protein RecN (Recombination protein N)